MGRLQDKQFTAAKRKPNERGKNSDISANDWKKLETIFCPPLDASLIAAIWNDTKNYASSFEILSMLAKDAPAVEDDIAESQPTTTKSLDIPEYVPANDDNSTSIPQPSEAEDELPKIDFLMRCFPDIPQEELEIALQEQDGDLQSATDIILNDMFLKEEEVSSDEVDTKADNVSGRFLRKILNIHDQGEVVQMAVDLILSRERDREKEQIMIEERLQELALYDKKEIKFDPLTGEIVSEAFPMLANDRVEAKLRAAEAAKEIRAIPEYLLIDNTEEYIEDDPEECRDIAFSLVLQRNEVYRKAADAYRRAKGKTNGEGGIAYYYSDEGRKMDVAAKEWNMRAARAIIRQHRIRQNDDHLLDLHGLTVAEAVELVKEGVNQWWSRSTMRAGRTKIKPLSIVTGIGKHSDHGQSRLYPAVMGLLTREGWKVDTMSRGSLLVTGLASGNKRK
ncbi:hypothetical protein K450DRAFT_245234 [Umbelopsis ramanniana AG]|uniref:Smr domain-containing protein n=1 Tax=Umbelopsis ramanniana AG TaxID=1314678 RepID=A0AAD5HD98_UMBRA|nr:uncharacterized protein K450DRAFT_245234 [Umbelopsis ramanniana AG]KAI8578729.1 hypothetical protein K450DRAFT_245234 [Umbelopsis ramanniana AG]